MGWRSLLAVLVGGMLGTALRLGIDLAVGQPVSTLAINVVGAFALGYLVSRVWPTARDWVRAGLGPGLLGSFTTFSAFAVTLVSLGASDEWMSVLAYSVATLALGLAGAWAGLRVGRRGSAVTR